MSTTLAGRHMALDEWLQLADDLGKLRRVDGADWDLEMGTITEIACLETKDPPCLLFDHIRGYPAGYRLMTNSFASKTLAAALLGIPDGLTSNEMAKAWRAKTRDMRLVPVREVPSGRVFRNVQRGNDIDLWKFPAPRWHEHDGGRYLGTGNIVVTRDYDDGSINVGCYRMMVHDENKLGLYISPGHHGRIHRDKYFAHGEPMPVVAAFGLDPLLHLGGSLTLAAEVNEYEWVGGVRGAPVEVIPGPVTGLPLPAHAEVVVEGFVHPDRFLDEGPLGEWTGYYASGVREEPYIQVEAVYHADDPIVLGSPPMRPPGDNYFAKRTIMHALIWDALEASGVPDVQAVTLIPSTSAGMLVISIKQRFGGHARQAALAAANSRSAAYLGRYIVVVDDDIDTENVDEVLWAIWTRSDPEDSLDLIRHCWSTPLDPRIPPERRERGDFTTSRLIIDATRPFHWRNSYPMVSGASRELKAAARQKWEALFRD